MAEEVKPDEWMEYVKKLDDANAKFYEKLRDDTSKFQGKMEALAGTSLASYPTFQEFTSLGKVIACIRQSTVDRDIIAAYFDAIVAAGTPAKADIIRAAVRSATTATVGG